MRFTLILVAFCVGIISCSKSGSSNPAPTNPDCNGVDSKFQANVLPLMQATCAVSGCHNTGSINGPGALTTHAQISASSAAIKAAVIAGTMPKNGSLTESQKKIIVCWINSGAQNN